MYFHSKQKNSPTYLLGHQCSSPAWLLTSQQTQHGSQPAVRTNTDCFRKHTQYLGVKRNNSSQEKSTVRGDINNKANINEFLGEIFNSKLFPKWYVHPYSIKVGFVLKESKVHWKLCCKEQLSFYLLQFVSQNFNLLFILVFFL